MSKFSLKNSVRNWIFRTLKKPGSPILILEALGNESYSLLTELSSQVKQLEENQILVSICSSFLQSYHNKEKKDEVKNHFVSYYYESPACMANLGDYIQTIATESAIRRCCQEQDIVFEPVLRGHLTNHQGGTCVMQGYYDHKLLTFLPGPDTRPVWIGTHFNADTRKLIDMLYKCSEIRYEDIGCRDISTMAYCQSKGITSYFSRCLTLTLPRREQHLSDGADTVYIVDCPEEIVGLIPHDIKEGAKIMSQRNFRFTSWQDWRLCRKAAEELLEEYKHRAKLVITTALHCAQPCLAMGIPVVLINPGYNEIERFSSTTGLIPLYSLQDMKEGKIIYPDNAPVFEDLKKAILKNLELTLKEQLSHEEIDIRQETRSFIAQYNIL